MIVYKPIGKIRAISLDLDDTLYVNWPYIVEAEQYLRAHINQHYHHAKHFSSQDWFAFKQQALLEDPDLCHDMGALRTVSLTKAFVKSGMPSEQIPAAVSDCFDTFYFKRSDFEVDISVHKTLSNLARKVPLVAITNGNVNLTQIGIDKYFTHVLHASKRQRMKPHADMFVHAATLLGIPAKHILHVGDNLEKDIWGAIRAGFCTAWYACDREMHLHQEYVTTLPHVQLDSIMEIYELLKCE